MKRLPYRARTAMGDTYDIDFPLHADTGDAVRVGQLASVLLDAIEKDIAIAGDISNGDVLQAMALAMAIRAGMIHAPSSVSSALAKQLLTTALEAMNRSTHRAAQAGHA